MKKIELDYEAMVQKNLRGVLRETLGIVAKHGLPSNHHFYITFLTNYPGVILPESLCVLYPEEITIVLQHEFWDLQVKEHGFFVTLCFDDTHENLFIPYSSIVNFVDPSVKFGLQFSPSFDLPFEQTTENNDEKPSSYDSGSNIISFDDFRNKK
jgi:hypothetical protein